MKIYTAPIQKRGLTNPIDITVKSGMKIFAPSWDIVMGLKNNRITWEQYKNSYNYLMRRSQEFHTSQWLNFVRSHEDDTITLVCYCQSPLQCHRTLLAQILYDQFKGIIPIELMGEVK